MDSKAEEQWAKGVTLLHTLWGWYNVFPPKKEGRSTAGTGDQREQLRFTAAIILSRRSQLKVFLKSSFKMRCPGYRLLRKMRLAWTVASAPKGTLNPNWWGARSAAMASFTLAPAHYKFIINYNNYIIKLSWLPFLLMCNNYNDVVLCWWMCLAIASRTLDAEPVILVACILVSLLLIYAFLIERHPGPSSLWS